MTGATSHLPTSKQARIAGLLYLLLAILGAFGMLYVPSALIVAGDPVTTANNIQASEGLFRLGIVGSLVTQLVQIGVVLALYQLLKSVNRFHARLMVIFILLGVPIAMLNEVNHFAVLFLLNGADFVGQFTTAQLHTWMMFFLQLHKAGIFIDHLFWGLWLIPMGYLVYKSGFLPRLIGFLLIIGGVGYILDFAIFALLPDLDLVMSEFTFIGELLITFWLLIMGVNTKRLQAPLPVAA